MDLEKVMEFDLAKDEKLDEDIRGFEMKVDKGGKISKALGILIKCRHNTQKSDNKISKYLRLTANSSTLRCLLEDLDRLLNGTFFLPDRSY